MRYNSPLDAIGNTPLVKINLPECAGTLYAKLEYFNPGGSVKDRSALFMIEHAERTGKLRPGGTLVDASSGNHGISVAMIGALKGYKVIITVSEKISKEKLETIKAYGAHVVMCPSTQFIEDSASYHSTALRIHKSIPNSFMPDQYFNIINADAHYSLLGPEIWRQTEGKITHFFAAAGTGGTISGVGRYLKEKNPHIKVIAMDSINSFKATSGNPKPYKVEGMGIDFISPVLNYDVIDEFINISDESAFNMLTILARNHALLAGPTSGAVCHGAYTFAQAYMKSDDIGVMIFGDSGRAYLTKQVVAPLPTYTEETLPKLILQNTI